MKPVGETVPTGINKTGNAVGWSNINGKRHVESNNTTTEDGMEHYSVNVVYVDVRFMCGNGKGFNVVRGIKQFIAAARAIDKDVCLFPLGGQDNNLCIPADVPNSKEGIQKYFRHRVSVNNVAGSIKIQTKFLISQLKHPSSTFRQYLNKEIMHINSAQFGVEEGVTMGSCWKSHPAFGYRNEMKSRLKLMMGKAHEDTSYALFPNNIRYICKSDRAKLSKTGIALRIVKRPSVSEQLFREELAQRWSNLSTKNGGSLASKFVIPFGKESTLGDSEMTHIIEQQNLYLQTTKQRIVRNLNDIDDEINFKTHNDVNMEESGTTIREILMKHLDNKGNTLFHSMEHTNNSDMYRLLFDESNTEQVDTLLGTIDELLDAMGGWDNADSHYRYHSHEKVNIFGIQPRGEQSDFWKKHFAGFVKNPIPSVIDTSHLHQSPKGRKNSNGVQPSYSDIARGRGPNENDSDATGPTDA
jgi:hypothetical protein